MSHFLKHLHNLNDAGWQCDQVSSYVENPMPMACFYIFMPACNEFIHASMPLDNFMDLIGNYMQKLPKHSLQPEILSGEIVNYCSNYHNVEYRRLLPMILGLYMASTRTGQQYFSTAVGRPFHFTIIMYPEDRQGKKFSVRPFLTMDHNPVLSTAVLKDRCEQVMGMDRQANKPYFKFLKKKHF